MSGRFVVQLEPGSRIAKALHRRGDIAIVEAPNAAALRALKNVRRVEPVYQGRFELASAIERSNIPQSWMQAAPNAGRGMRIAMIDSGIDPKHPAFQTSDLTMPEGFPRARHESDLEYTSAKIIVIRNYQDILRVSRPTPLDTVNHGTATAGAAAAVMHSTPYGWMSGAAPAAHLGIYKVGPAGNGAAWQTDAVILAIHDAIADGMDVICLSLGFTYGTPYGETLLSEAIEKAERAGILVIGAAGNGGPNPRTIGAISVSDALITTGALLNDRRFMNAVRADGAQYPAYASTSAKGPDQITAPLVDVETLDRDGLACRPLAGLAGRIALIARGGCTFAEKLANAAAGGAAAAVIYTTSGDPFAIPATASTLPTLMIANADGLALKRQRNATVTLDFRLVPVSVPADAIAAFSARGPSPMLTIEPDVSAVGESIVLPLPNGEYKVLQGTSFSAPLLAGAAAVLKQQRPGLTPAQYRSLLVNTAAGVRGMKPQEAGAGLFDLAAAMRSPVAAAQTSLNFGISYAGSLSVRRDLHIANLSAVAQDLSVSVESAQGDSAPAPEANTLRLEPGATGRIILRWNAPSMKAGAYQGVIRVGPLRIPYWAAVPADRPAFITVLRGSDTWPAHEVVSFVLNVTDEAGVLTGSVRPSVIPVEGAGLVNGQTLQVTPLNGLDGNYFVMVMLAKEPGINQFRIQAGSARATVSFAGVPD